VEAGIEPPCNSLGPALDHIGVRPTLGWMFWSQPLPREPHHTGIGLASRSASQPRAMR
jgi:hypothetical protein